MTNRGMDFGAQPMEIESLTEANFFTKGVKEVGRFESCWVVAGENREREFG